jgi:hypothetical protein
MSEGDEKSKDHSINKPPIPKSDPIEQGEFPIPRNTGKSFGHAQGISRAIDEELARKAGLSEEEIRRLQQQDDEKDKKKGR